MKSVLLFIIAIITFNNVNASSSMGHLHIETIGIANEFKKIKSSELPPAVVEEILKQYPTSKLRQAYKDNRNTYKLVMVLSSGTARTVYIDAYGRWIQKKKKH